MADLVNDAVEAVRMLSDDTDATITTDFFDGDDTIIADRIHMTNAIVNLLSNSLKYTPDTPAIRMKTFPAGNSVALSISDNGIGIPVKYQKFIFDKYYRVPTGDVHNIKGFGIGLSYVKRIVTAHGGKVMVQSEPGKGSTFTLSIPKTV